MPFASATSDGDADEPTGGSQADPLCLMTDDFNRTSTPYDGGYTTGNNWTVSENTGLPWHGGAVYTFVDGNSGVLGMSGPPAPPRFGFDQVFGQEAFLNWAADRTPMDILLLGRLTRSLAPDDTGHPTNPDYWGEYLWFFFGDGPPFGTGKCVFVMKGSTNTAFLENWNEPGISAEVSLGGINVTNPFYIRVQCAGPSQPWTVDMWDASLDPSSGIHLSLPKTGFSNHGFTVELSTNNNNVVGTIEFHLESLDVTGLNSCTP